MDANRKDLASAWSVHANNPMNAVQPQPNRQPRVLVLWDIDHTLIESRGVGRAVYRRAFRVATGRELDAYAIVAGRTEQVIAAELLRLNGFEPHSVAVRTLIAALVSEFESAKSELAIVGRALPGAAATLKLLADDPRICQSVLTGNVRSLAKLKLETFGLDLNLDLDIGAYGDDHENRANLVYIAQRRATTRGVTFEAHNTVLIGDTLYDVQAAKGAGARVIAVATGECTFDELHAAGADAVLPDLTNGEHLKGLISNFAETRGDG